MVTVWSSAATKPCGGRGLAEDICPQRQFLAFTRAILRYGHGIHSSAAAIDRKHRAGKRVVPLGWVGVGLNNGDIAFDAAVGQRKRRSICKAHVHRMNGGIKGIALRRAYLLHIIRPGDKAIHAAIALRVGGDGAYLLPIGVGYAERCAGKRCAVITGLVDLDTAGGGRNKR